MTLRLWLRAVPGRQAYRSIIDESILFGFQTVLFALQSA